MRIVEDLLSKWFVPKRQHESLEFKLAREIEVNNLTRGYARQISSEALYKSTVSDQELLTDDFYKGVLAQIKSIKEQQEVYRDRLRLIGRQIVDYRDFESSSLAQADVDRIFKAVCELSKENAPLREGSRTLADIAKGYLGIEIENRQRVSREEYFQIEIVILQRNSALRKIAAIALRDGSLEESTSPLDAEVIDKILNAIAGLRGEIADLKEREQNYIEALRLSQQEVKQAAEAHAETKAWYRQQCEEMLAIANKIFQGLD